MKIKHYSERLEDYIKSVRRAAPVETKAAEPETKAPVMEAAQIDIKDIRALDDTEQEVLKRSHHGREISSEEYTKDIDSYVLEEMQELSELEGEIEEDLLEFEESKDLRTLKAVAERLARYASTISLLFEFADLSYAVRSLSELLDGIDAENCDGSKIRKINLFLTNIVLDLSTWRKTIFVDQNTKDIHYLDSSLFSAILQLELVLNEEKGAIDGGDDLELF